MAVHRRRTHGPFGTLEMQRMLQAGSSSGNCPCLIRVPGNDLVYIKQALDIGAAGIIVPQINNAEEAQAAVRAANTLLEQSRCWLGTCT